MDKNYAEEITIANAATNTLGIDVSIVRDYMYGELKPITNADRVRSMTDEELAELISFVFATGVQRIRSSQFWRDWLREEAKE